MLPRLELRGADIDRCPTDMSEQNVGVPDDEFVPGITHRRGSIAATSRLMKQDRAVLPDDFIEQLERCGRCGNLVLQRPLPEAEKMTDADDYDRAGKSGRTQKKPSFLGL